MKGEVGKWMSRQEVSEALTVCLRTVDTMLKTGEIPHYKFRNSVRVRRQDLLDYIDTCVVNEDRSESGGTRQTSGSDQRQQEQTNMEEGNMDAVNYEGNVYGDLEVLLNDLDLHIAVYADSHDGVGKYERVMRLLRECVGQDDDEREASLDEVEDLLDEIEVIDTISKRENAQVRSDIRKAVPELRKGNLT